MIRSERVEGELIGSIDGTIVHDVCLSIPGVPAMWDCVNGIVGLMNRLVIRARLRCAECGCFPRARHRMRGKWVFPG